MSKVSVITPTYNSAKTIETCIKSVQAQRNVDIEHIVVDGLSTDSTIEIVERYPCVKWISERDYGIFDALNKGIDKSTGEFVAICHSDDQFCSEKTIVTLVNAMQKEHTEFAYADCVYVHRGKWKRYYKSGNLNKSRLSYGIAPAHTTLVARKSLLTLVGDYSLEYPVCSDFEFFTRLLGKSYSYVDKPMVYMGTGGASSFQFKTAMQINVQLKKILSDSKIPTSYPKLYFRYLHKQFTSRYNLLVPQGEKYVSDTWY